MSVDKFYTSKFLSEYKNRLSKNVLNENSNSDINNEETTDEDVIRLECMICAVNETLKEIIEDANKIASEETLEEASFSQKIRKMKDKIATNVIKLSLAEKQLSEKINDKFNRFLQIHRESKRTANYDKLVKNAIDLSRTLKNIIGSFIVGLLVPGGIQTKLILAAIALLTKIAYDKRVNLKYKGMILNDLRFELRVVQEKIRDAESRGDIRAKYKLMRIENQLARAIDRIKYNLRDYQ